MFRKTLVVITIAGGSVLALPTGFASACSGPEPWLTWPELCPRPTTTTVPATTTTEAPPSSTSPAPTTTSPSGVTTTPEPSTTSSSPETTVVPPSSVSVQPSMPSSTTEVTLVLTPETPGSLIPPQSSPPSAGGSSPSTTSRATTNSSPGLPATGPDDVTGWIVAALTAIGLGAIAARISRRRT